MSGGLQGGMKATEDHIEAGGRIKSIVFGGLDGILTSFAIVSGAVGAHLGPVVILAMGISNVLADALSMGAGEYLSSRSYNNYVRKELEREQWELENFPEGEIMEMIEENLRKAGLVLIKAFPRLDVSGAKSRNWHVSFEPA